MSNVSSSNSHKELIPKLHFNQFKENWNPYFFGALLEETDIRTKTENQDTLLSAAINGMFLNSELFGHQRGQSNKGYKLVQHGDLILSTQNLHLGNANVNMRFEHGMVSPAYKTYRIVGCSSELLSHWVKSDKAKEFFFNATTVGASVCRRNVEWETLYNQIILLPQAEEQSKIANFLSLISERIEKQQNLVSALKSYKRGVFSQLYDIFLSKAQEVKLCDIVECLDSQRIPINSSERAKRKGIYPYYGANGIQDYIDQYIFDGEFVLLAEDGGHFDDFNENAIAQYVRGKIWVNNHAHILQTNKCNIKFLYYMLEHKDIRSYINGTSRSKLNQEDMMQISISLPSETIQTKIVTLLSGIDNNIILAETIYQELVEYKSGLLQQLFI